MRYASMRTQYEERPPFIATTTMGGALYTTVNFCIEELPGGGFAAESVTLKTEAPLTEDDYGTLVSAIIRERYSADAVEAITSNYIVTPRSEEDKAEMREFQAWRTEAKTIARAALEEIAGGGEDAGNDGIDGGED